MALDSRRTVSAPRQCFYIPIEQFHPEHGYIPSLVTEGEPGHSPLMGKDELAMPWYWGKTYEEAVANCAAANERNFHLTAEEVTEIVNSSIAASIRKDAEAERQKADYERKLGRTGPRW